MPATVRFPTASVVTPHSSEGCVVLGNRVDYHLLKKWAERIIMPEGEAGGWTTAWVWVWVDHSLHGTCFTEGQGI